MKTTIKTYKSAKAFKKDVKWMKLRGWTPTNVSGHEEGQNILKSIIAGAIFFPWAFRKKTKVIVTWVK